MSSLAELMFQSASQNIRDTKSDPTAIAKSYAQGAQLAQRAEQIKINREQIQNQVKLTEAKRDGIWLDKISKAAKLENTKMKNLLFDQIEREAANAGSPMDPGFIKGLKSSSASALAISEAQNNYQEAWRRSVETGQPTPALEQARAQLGDMMYGGNLEPLVEREAQFERAKLVQEGQSDRQQTQIQAKEDAETRQAERFPVQERQKKVISAHTNFMGQNGFARTEQNIKRAEKYLNMLKSGKLETGTKGLQAASLNDAVMRRTFPEIALAQDQLQGAVNVKSALDSQFSDAMAVRVFSRIFDPAAPSEFNQERLKEFIDTSKAELKTKKSLFDEFQLPTNPDAPKRQKEGESQLKVGQEQISRIKEARMNNPAYKNLTNEEFFEQLMSVPGMTRETANQIIRDIQIKQNPERK